MVEVEFGVRLPERAGGCLDGAHAETLEHQEAIADDLAQAPKREPFAEHQHAADHHQVVRTIHAQPRGVDRGHFFAFRAFG